MSSDKARGKRPAAPPEPDPPPRKKIQTKGPKAARSTKSTEFSQAKMNTKNWVKLDDKEASLAAYLGFGNTSELRKFAISWPALRAEKYFAAAAKNMRKQQPFAFLAEPQLLKDITPVEESPDVVWALEEDDSPREKATLKAKIVAWCLHRMVLDVQELKSATAEENAERTRAEQAKFLVRHKGNKIGDGFTFPGKMEAFTFPELGPLVDTGENELESYNRCWEVLHYVASGFYKQNWKNRFATSEVVNTGTVVKVSQAPSWMQPAPRKVHPSLAGVAQPSPSDSWPPIKVDVHWIHRRKDKHYEDTVSALEEAESRGKTIPSSQFQFPWDPRLCQTVEHFRDQIRQSINCSELGLDLQSIKIEYHRAGDDPDDFKQVDGFSQDWEALKKIFHDPKHADFVIEVCLEPFDNSDPTSMYEDEGSPIDKLTCLAIANDLKKTWGKN